MSQQLPILQDVPLNHSKISSSNVTNLKAGEGTCDAHQEQRKGQIDSMVSTPKEPSIALSEHTILLWNIPTIKSSILPTPSKALGDDCKLSTKVNTNGGDMDINTSQKPLDNPKKDVSSDKPYIWKEELQEKLENISCGISEVHVWTFEDSEKSSERKSRMIGIASITCETRENMKDAIRTLQIGCETIELGFYPRVMIDPFGKRALERLSELRARGQKQHEEILKLPVRSLNPCYTKAPPMQNFKPISHPLLKLLQRKGMKGLQSVLTSQLKPLSRHGSKPGTPKTKAFKCNRRSSPIPVRQIESSSSTPARRKCFSKKIWELHSQVVRKTTATPNRLKSTKRKKTASLLPSKLRIKSSSNSPAVTPKLRHTQVMNSKTKDSQYHIHKSMKAERKLQDMSRSISKDLNRSALSDVKDFPESSKKTPEKNSVLNENTSMDDENLKALNSMNRVKHHIRTMPKESELLASTPETAKEKKLPSLKEEKKLQTLKDIWCKKLKESALLMLANRILPDIMRRRNPQADTETTGSTTYQQSTGTCSLDTSWISTSSSSNQSFDAKIQSRTESDDVDHAKKLVTAKKRKRRVSARRKRRLQEKSKPRKRLKSEKKSTSAPRSTGLTDKPASKKARKTSDLGPIRKKKRAFQ